MSELESLEAAWAALPYGEGAVGCAAPDDIWDAVAGLRSEEQVRVLLTHSLSCAECSALWRLAHDLAAASGETVAPERQAEPVPLHRRAKGLLGVGALAAAAVLVFAILPRLGARQEPPVVRGQEEDVLRPDPSASTLDRSHPVLRWSGAPEGSRYSVTVSTPDLTVLVRKNGLLAPDLELSPGTLSSVASGSDVVWRVEATLPDGRRVASKAFLSRVK